MESAIRWKGSNWRYGCDNWFFQDKSENKKFSGGGGGGGGGGIKACHMFMGNLGNNIPTIICKFVYFDNKHAVYTARRNLKCKKNNWNKRKIYKTERLLEQEAINKKAAIDMNSITTTHKCIVQTLVHDESVGAK